MNLHEYQGKSILKSFFLFWNSQLKKIANLVNRIGKKQLQVAFIAFIMIGLGSYTVLDSTKQFYENEYQSRTPASVIPNTEKPAYTMFTRKTAVIFKVQVPIYSEKLKSIRNITVDFTVRTSTRFSKQYLEFHQ